jgi:hypothetical protein
MKRLLKLFKAKDKPNNLKDVINIKIEYKPIELNYNNVGSYDFKK